ncbi:signal transduction histidine kinase [Actinomadura pelletieri DSM 43383]|uniref:histidine kinase n=1 Tax=Actinomadura pelletieri DSM 43383 TaxID=1120940 RepID=A0A495QMV8_9ACTN|nr:HAMP domain-containing sensor histidine kinase [Actinomadura pelletieri]RKS74297.1 signal transduction histidine kinase [Actinomadura pelletieri DSM 43383]
MRERWARLWSVRVRAACGAMVATAFVFALGALVARAVVEDQWTKDARDHATDVAFQVTFALETGRVPVGVRDAYVVVSADGRYARTGGVSTPPTGEGRGRTGDLEPDRPGPGFVPAVGWGLRKIRTPSAVEAEGTVQTYVVGTTDPLPPARFREATGLDTRSAQRLTVYTLVASERARTAVMTLDRLVRWGMPGAVLFVGLTAWLVTGLALRPVEAIRAKMAGITAGDLDQRVPVPPTTDVVAGLARTTNETLDRLERAHLRQRRFVADASHELRSPLAALRGTLEIPLARPARADWPAVAAAALADTVRLQRLTDDLLLLSAEGHRPREDAAAVDLADLVEEQIAERAYSASGAAPAFGCEVERPALVRGEETRLARVVRNLLDNAARHARSTVHATVRRDADTVVLTVTDDGAGVPPADRERIFDRFVRLDDARTRADGGAGLGLAIVRELVTALGGTVRVTDGSTFTVRLPDFTKSFC